MFSLDRPSGRTIAIANYDFRASGTVAKSIEIAAAAADAGLDAQLWVIHAHGPLRARVPSSVPIFTVGQNRASRSREGELALNIPALARALRERQPHIFLSGGNHFHLPARLALKLSGKSDSIRSIMRASNSARHGGPIGWREKWSSRLKYGGSDLIVAVSQELAEEVTLCGVRKPVRCIPNGVDIDRVRTMGEGDFSHPFLDRRASSGPLIVSMGRLARQKGFDLLIRALAMLPRDLDARLLIIGDGDPAYRAKLGQLSDQLDVADRIGWLGYQVNPFAIMSRCDLFVTASRWEGASNTLLEALALGLPLVATNCPTGNIEVVERGPFGTVAPPEDAAGLAAAIQQEWAIRRDRAAQAAGARFWAIDRCLADWVSLLSE